MQLTQKEKELLKDLKGQEKLCVEKYSQHAAAANDEQLSQLLNYLGGVEQRHLDIITKIDSGEIPQPAAGEAAPKNDFKQTYSVSETQEKKNDCYICSDLLATEKPPPRSMTHASSSSRTNSSERFSTPSSARSRSTARKYMTICPRTICIRDAKRPSLGAVFYISP